MTVTNSPNSVRGHQPRSWCCMPEKRDRATEEYRRHWEANGTQIAEALGDRLKLIEATFDTYAAVERYFHWVAVRDDGITAIRTPLKSAMTLCYKSSLAIFSAYELTRHGFHGSAAPLLRQSYEALMIGKYCALVETELLHEQWLRGDPVLIGRDILRHIRSPDPEPLRVLWRELCQITHLSIYAQQYDLSFSHNETAVAASLVIIMMLLECTYHLLGSYVISPTTQYYAVRYGKATDLIQLRRELKSCFAKSREHLSSDAVRAVNCYKRRWTLIS